MRNSDKSEIPENIRVEGFGEIGFPEMRELLQGASDEQKQRWADTIAAMPYGPAQRLAAVALYAAWVQLDASAACESLRHFADPLLRLPTIDPVICAAPATALPSLAEMVRKLSPFEQRQLVSLITKQWASTDAAAAAEFLARDRESPENRAAIPEVIAEWAQDDLPAVRAWLEQSNAFGADAEVLGALVSEWVKSDLEGAVEYMRARAASPGSYEALHVVAAELYRLGLNRAAAFIRSLPEDAQATAAGAVFRTAEGGALSQMPEAITWASQLPPAIVEGQLGRLLASWIGNDPDGASTWVKARPTAERTRLIDEVCRSGPFTKPVVQLALSLPDETRRDAAIRALITTHLAYEPDKLPAAVAALGLPPKEAAYLLRMGGGAQ